MACMASSPRHGRTGWPVLLTVAAATASNDPYLEFLRIATIG